MLTTFTSFDWTFDIKGSSLTREELDVLKIRTKEIIGDIAQFIPPTDGYFMLKATEFTDMQLVRILLKLKQDKDFEFVLTRMDSNQNPVVNYLCRNCNISGFFGDFPANSKKDSVENIEIEFEYKEREIEFE